MTAARNSFARSNILWMCLRPLAGRPARSRAWRRKLGHGDRDYARLCVWPASL